MNSEYLIASFAEFAQSRKIDRPTVIKILDDVFRAMIRKKFGSDDNFDIVVNLDQGDLEIWRFRTIVEDNAQETTDSDKITLSEAKKVEPDFEVGEEVSEEIKIDDFGRRAVTAAKQTLIQKIRDLEKDNLYQKYSPLVGEIVTSEVYQILGNKVILHDDERNELVLPRSEQISKDRFKKGEHVRGVIHKVELQGNVPKIFISRTSSVFLERLFENEVPEISDGVIVIKKIVREPGERAKVAVESYDDRVDPVGACVGMKGARIHSIVRELRNENIDVINYTDNLNLYITRALSPAKISNIQEIGDRIAVYLKPDQVSLAIGRGGQNIKLASRLIGREIDVYRELDEQDEEDVDLVEFVDEIAQSTLDALTKAGFKSAKQVLNTAQDEVITRTSLDKTTVAQVYETLRQEFEK